jgi:hypothetical protein
MTSGDELLHEPARTLSLSCGSARGVRLADLAEATGPCPGRASRPDRLRDREHQVPLREVILQRSPIVSPVAAIHFAYA